MERMKISSVVRWSLLELLRSLSASKELIGMILRMNVQNSSVMLRRNVMRFFTMTPKSDSFFDRVVYWASL
jgi:hypothetical protein